MGIGEALSDRRLERIVLGWFRDLGKRTGAFAVSEVRAVENSAFDFALRLSPSSGKAAVELLVEAKARVTPQELFGVLDRLRPSVRRHVAVLCSPSISSRVMELCREHGLGYLDAAGNCHISAPGLFLHVEGRANPYRTTRKTIDPFAVKSSRIARVLLSDPRREWQVQELAREACVSLGLASRVKAVLVREALAEIRNGRVCVRDPRALLDAWAAAYKLPEQRPLYVMSDPADVQKRIKESCSEAGTPYALTAFSGAWRAAPMVRHAVTTVYVDAADEDGLQSLARDIGAKPVDSGSNLSLWLPADEFTFYGAREIEGTAVVSPLQLYLDLTALTGRGAEAAREVFENEIQPRW